MPGKSSCWRMPRAFDPGIGAEADERAKREMAELYAKIGQLTVERA